MKPLKLINITINSDGSVTDKNGKTIKILPLNMQIEKEKQKIREYK